tara:strand:+ start:3870 stop:7271 length:3402 start_codon:yes stop_codon:yes gene_type:complete
MKAPFLLILVSLFSFTFYSSNAQEGKLVTGKVIDEYGLPIESASVVVQEKNKGVVTDLNGLYSILLSPDDLLEFSFIGFKTQSIIVGVQSVINITLIEDIEILDGVVITGYQNIDREIFTGSSQTLKAADIKLDGVPDITQALEGRAPGVAVQNVTGSFGAAPRITIRGSSSILGDTKPLWIVDGAIQESIVDISFADLVAGDINSLLSSALAGLNPNDIESFEVLKDASAGALYGARALNGVVVITTKSGKRNQIPTFTYSSEYAIREIPSYNDYDVLNSQETVAVYQQLNGYNTGFLDFPSLVAARNSGVYGLLANALNTQDSNGDFLAENTQEGKAAYLRQFELANTDWFKELFNSSPTQTHTISFSSGSENSTSYASLGYYSDTGWTIADRVSRLTANVRNTFYLGKDGNEDRLKLTTQLNGSVRDQRAPGTFDREPDQFFGSFTREFDINPFSYALNTSRAVRPRDNNGNLEFIRQNWAPFNILQETENNFVDLNVIDVRFQTKIDYEINDNLDYTFLGTARYVSSLSNHSVTEFSNGAEAYRADNETVRDANTFLFTDPEDIVPLPRVVLPSGGILTENENTLTTYTFRNTLEYKKRFNELHGLTVYSGQEYRHTDRSDSFNTGYGYQFSRGGAIFTDPDILRKTILEGNDYFGATQTRSREVTFFTQLTYDYDKKYILNVSGNYEGSNRAGKTSTTRWLPTYNASARWNIHRESFMENSNVFNKLVLRLGYGLTALIANTASNNEAIFRNQVTDRGRIDDRENFIDIEDLENSELTWEKSVEYNVGLDVGLYDNRVVLGIDTYYRDGKDLIDFVTSTGIGGQSIKLGNNSNLVTKGLEFQISSSNIKNDNFSWNSGFNISFLDQEITSLKQEPNVFDLVSGQGFGNVVGFAPNSLFSYNFEGLTTLELDSSGIVVTPGGLPLFTSAADNHDGDIDFQDTDNPLAYLKHEGSLLPNVTGGLSNNFSYKNFDLSFFISFSAGNKIRLDSYYSSLYNDATVFPGEFVNRWIVPGDENSTSIPAVPSTRVLQDIGNTSALQRYNAYNFSSERIADGDFIRMKNITLGYSFSQDVITNLGLSRLRMSLQSTNPFLIYSDKKLGGQDPEFVRSGGVAFPITTLYTFTLNIGF